MTANLIGLYSSVMGSGKTTVTSVLENEYKFVNVKFAGTLKGMIHVLLKEVGYHTASDYTDGPLKETILPEFGVSTRYLMQTLGTEWGRGQIKGTLWVDVTKAKIGRLLSNGWNVVVDDVRFPNEFDLIRELGGVMVQVVRPAVAATNGHVSEGLLDDHHFDTRLMNVEGVAELQGMARILGDRLTKSAVV